MIDWAATFRFLIGIGLAIYLLPIVTGIVWIMVRAMRRRR